jgi:enoyl-CoA hydratase
MVRYERRGTAALVTIDRPERRNAIDGPTAEALHDAFRRFAADDEARVLVLAGAGEEAFCAGADLKSLETLGPRLDLPEGPLGFTRMAAPKPTIAAITGWCLAGGFELALWCDLRVATPSARFGFTERRFGVPLIDGGTQRLPRIVGSGRALDLVLSGRVVEVEEAERIGLVTEVVAPGKQVERALAMAERLAAFPPGHDALRPPGGARGRRAPAREGPRARGAARPRPARHRARGRRALRGRRRAPRRRDRYLGCRRNFPARPGTRSRTPGA